MCRRITATDGFLRAALTLAQEIARSAVAGSSGGWL
jgi:hypothetical protein